MKEAMRQEQPFHIEEGDVITVGSPIHVMRVRVRGIKKTKVAICGAGPNWCEYACTDLAKYMQTNGKHPLYVFKAPLS